MKIKIKHLGYTVMVKPRSKFKGFDYYVAVTQKNSPDQSTVYIDLPIKRKEYATLAHELVHVLQYICDSRGIEFTQEQENTAYLMQYLLNEITGYKYENTH